MIKCFCQQGKQMNKAHVAENLYLNDTHQGKLDFLQKLETPS